MVGCVLPVSLGEGQASSHTCSRGESSRLIFEVGLLPSNKGNEVGATQSLKMARRASHMTSCRR